MAVYKVREGAITYQLPKQVEMCGPESVATLLKSMKTYKQEVFKVVLLDIKNNVIAVITAAKGTLGSAHVHPRDVFRQAIVRNAYSMVVAHNHPSGNPTASQDDIVFTTRLVKCGELIGIRVADHIILGKFGYVSLREQGEM